ncbi:MAG TPA: CRISPR-associated ring nuclease Csm6 [Candidatus Acidoferrales bacterium]|nr:CRISPR-associated ring nuclease Csm6 [Candidatus Acidoferrales bacterium]
MVTETLWALARQKPPVWPRELRIITTQSGADACARLLLGKRGKLASYFREYRQPKARCASDNVIVLRGADGEPIEDLRTPQDNLVVAEQIAAVIRDLTARPNVRLHCSVAGGRKTMGVLLALVLQIYGRPQDRLYHVLVPAPFESRPDFFYIPRRPRPLAVHKGKQLDPSQARIELAEIPYVRLRAFLSQELLKGSLPFTELVALAQKELRALEKPEPVRVDLARRRLVIGDAVVPLSLSRARLYTAFARIKTTQCAEPARKTCGECIACYPSVSKANWDSVRERLESLAGDNFLWPSDPYDPAVALARFRSLVSKTNETLAKRLGSERLAKCYRIRSDGPRGDTCYGLAVDKSLIRVES